MSWKILALFILPKKPKDPLKGEAKVEAGSYLLMHVTHKATQFSRQRQEYSRIVLGVQ